MDVGSTGTQQVHFSACITLLVTAGRRTSLTAAATLLMCVVMATDKEISARHDLSGDSRQETALTAAATRD